MEPGKESVLTPLETPVTVPPDSRQAPNVTFPPDRIEPATLPALAERIEAWVRAWVASEKPPEYVPIENPELNENMEFAYPL